MHFELRRDELEHGREVFADALFRPAAARARLLLLRHVVLDAVMRQVLERSAAPTAHGLGPFPLSCRVGPCGRRRVIRAGQLGDLEEMPLGWVVDMPFATRAEDVAAQQGKRFEHLGVLLPATGCSRRPSRRECVGVR